MVATTIKNRDLVETKRDQIIEAAVKLIEEKGFRGMTLRDISRATNMSLGNLYAYIGSKDDILFLVHRKASQILNENFEAYKVETGGPAERLQRMIEVEFDSKNSCQDLVMLLYRETHELDRERLREILGAEERRLAAFEKVITEGMKAGVFRAVNPAIVVHSIMSLIDGWVLRRWGLQKQAKPEEMKKYLSETVLGSLVTKAEPLREQRRKVGSTVQQKR